MNLLRSLSGFIVISAIIAAASLLPPIYAQEVSITTSAEDVGGVFFGEGVIQIVVDDPRADSGSAIEDITVTIDASPDSGSDGTVSIVVPETGQSSGSFEFFLVHESAGAVGPADLEPINNAGVEGDGSCISGCAPFVTFGPTADLQVDADLYEDVTFDITAGDATKRVEYEETLSQVELDRNSYGRDSFVYVFVLDQDANLNPTAADEFVVDPGDSPNSDLFELSGGNLADVITFRETGDNSARFEGRYELGGSMTADSEALVLTLFDKANYGDTLDAAENDSNGIDEVSFTVGDSDGDIDVGGEDQATWDALIMSDKAAYSLGETVTITVDDPDANSSSSASDNIEITLTVPSGSAVLSVPETGLNTGVFTAEIAIGLDGSIEGTQLNVEEGDRITAVYVDEKPADYAEKLQSGQDPEKEFALEIRLLEGDTDLPAIVMAPVVKGSLNAGTELAVSTVIQNKGNSSQPFTVLVEVRDSADITVFLAWQSGTIMPEGSSTIELAWTPDVTGEYELRSFAVSGLEEGSVMAQVAQNTVTVS